MGHQNWIFIGNEECSDFNEKIKKTKEAVLEVIGKSPGAHFNKKILLQKSLKVDSSAIPLESSLIDKAFYEEISIWKTFIDYKTNEGEVISSSVEKKGAKIPFTYTLKVNLMVNEQKVVKKRNISESEYDRFMSNIKQGTKTLHVKRLCLIENATQIMVDYYPEIDGQPMLGIVKVKKGIEEQVNLPEYIKVYREVTDEKQYLPQIMCKDNYYMDDEDKKGTNTFQDYKK